VTYVSERQSIIDPWASIKIDDYEQLFREFGIESFAPYVKAFPDAHLLMRRGVVVGHRDFQLIYNCIKSKKPFVAITGRATSGPMHFGHKMVFDLIVWYQRHGADVFIPLSEAESYAVRGVPWEECRRIGLEEIVPSLIALGLEPTARIYFQTDMLPLLKLAYTFSRKITLNEAQSIYGFSGSDNMAKIFFPFIQVADILLTQLQRFGGPRPTIVPVSIDQDPHIRITRDVAERFVNEYSFVKPSSTYHKFLSGLKVDPETGKPGKMSASDPESSVFLTDPPDVAAGKLLNAFTGGQPTVKEQKEKGGNPDICSVFEWLKYHLIEDDKKLSEIYNACKSGNLVCGDCKAHASELIYAFMRDHHYKREQARKIVHKYMMHS
jgi:tryptophanyl-tRNA synthetase